MCFSKIILCSPLCNSVKWAQASPPVLQIRKLGHAGGMCHAQGRVAGVRPSGDVAALAALLLPVLPPSPSLHSLSCSVYRVATDHNADNTSAVLREWLVAVKGLYHSVEWRPSEEPR